MLQNSKEQATGLQVLNFEGAHFRAQVINNEPCFVAKDLCRILGISKYRDVLRHLDSDETVSTFVDTLGGRQRVSAVNESGFYHLVFLSRSPKARDFRRMVTMEILPTLRKTGRFELKSRRRLLPRERSEEMKSFFDELTKWIRVEDEREVADIMRCSVKHVHEVLRGRKQSYGVCCLLVDQAKENRRNGVKRIVWPHNRQAEMRELVIEFVNDLEVEG